MESFNYDNDDNDTHTDPRTNKLYIFLFLSPLCPLTNPTDKPSCATLHLHSLDLITETVTTSLPKPLTNGTNNRAPTTNQQHQQPTMDTNLIIDTSSRPLKATSQDEYSIVSETSDDYIALRRILVTSPLPLVLNANFANHNRHSAPAPKYHSSSPSSSSSSSSATNITHEQLAAQLDGRDAEYLNVASPFEGSIFKQILDDMPRQTATTATTSSLHADVVDTSESSPFANRYGGGGIIGSSSSSLSPPFSLPASIRSPVELLSSNLRNNKGGDSWNKFNELLLKFLNDYSNQVRQMPASMSSPSGRRDKRRSSKWSSSTDGAQAPAGANSPTLHHQRQQPIQSRMDTSNALASNTTATPAAAAATVTSTAIKNYLTFACMAQDGNPMNNLTFDWYFGSMRLPASMIEATTTTPMMMSNSSNVASAATAPTESRPPMLVYSNSNGTLQILLQRRLDTRQQLSPFQMSLLTINVISLQNHYYPDQRQSAPDTNKQQETGGNINRSQRQSPSSTPSTHSVRPNANINTNRYQSMQQQHGNNLQFANELLDSIASDGLSAAAASTTNNNRQRPAILMDNIMPNSILDNLHHHHVELNEFNWQDKLGQLLKCTVSNQIGTSDACEAHINQAERRRHFNDLAGGGSSASSSFYEFARWRMLPSLAQKSLLIISLLVACTLIVLATFALLMGPQMHLLQLAASMGALRRFKTTTTTTTSSTSSSSSASSDNSGLGTNTTGGADDGINTGHSSGSSQKSSILGLLGSTGATSSGNASGGECSFHGSSDDSDSNNHLSSLQQQQQQQQKHGRQLPVDVNPFRMRELNIRSSANRTALMMLRDHQQSMSGDYDKPRQSSSTSEHKPKLIYRPGESGGYFSSIRGSAATTSTDPRWKQSLGATGNRILASLRLKPMNNKFKIDRIGDHTLHSRNISETTATTGLSVQLGGDPAASVDEVSMISPAMDHSMVTGAGKQQGSVFGMPNWRHSYSGFTQSRAPPTHRPPQQPNMDAFYANSRTIAGEQRNQRASSSGWPLLDNGSDSSTSSTNVQNANRTMMQLSSKALNATANLVNEQRLHQQQQMMPNAMDEFLRKRGLDTSPDGLLDHHQQLSGSQTLIRNQSRQMFALRNDLISATANRISTIHEHETHNQLINPVNNNKLKPPIFPRSNTMMTGNGGGGVGSSFNASSHLMMPAARSQVLDSWNVEAQQNSLSSTSSHYHNTALLTRQNYTDDFSLLNHNQPAASHHHHQHQIESYNIHQQQQRQSSNMNFASYANTIDLNNHASRAAYDPYSNNNVDCANIIQAYQVPYNPYASTPTANYQPTSTNRNLTEHIYDLNAYATPEQTPLRSARPQQQQVDNHQFAFHLQQYQQHQHQQQHPIHRNAACNQGNDESTPLDGNRPAISQLIQTFNSKSSDSKP